MNWFKNLYNIFFLGFILSIIIIFFCLRPLNSPWHRFIGGDGFGYYSYLPAKFIYNDSNYEFKWFNKVYAQHYVINTGPSADDNFLITYKDRRINKYYQGMSLLWLPFFTVAHVVAKLSSYPADGFSLPYQICIGTASLFYLFLGLFFLRKLLQKLFRDEFVALIVPVLLFYGTFLFHYAIDLNSLTHIYSFTFITLFIYYTYCFFNEGANNKYLLTALLCLVIIVCIRPVNGLVILIIPAFIPKHFFKDHKIKIFPLKTPAIVALLMMTAFLVNQLSILYIQTGSFFPNTYTDEKFYFGNPKLVDVLFSYRMGLFVYVPLFFVALFGTLFLDTLRKKVILLFVFFLVVYIYSSWWYWPITQRALVDYYVIPAILLAALLHGIKKRKVKISFLVILLLFAGYHRLKSMQLLSGILDDNLTYRELFWKNFFRVKKMNIYAIPPSTIIRQESYKEGFEDDYPGKTEIKIFKGKYAAVINSSQPYSKPFTNKVPQFFDEDLGTKKIRFSLMLYFTKPVKQAQVYFKFYDADDKEIKENIFYISEDVIEYDTWTKMEFGCAVNEDMIRDEKLDNVSIFLWNNEAKGEIFIDDVKTEFILADKSYEITP